MSSVAVASFRWLDMLEKEFDKAVIDFDLSLTDIQTESDNGDLIDETLYEFIENSRDKLKAISTAWSQLVHKSQTIFQVNCKLEAQLVNLKSDLVEARAFKKASEKELEKLMIELHSAQLKLQKLKSNNSVNNQSSNNSQQTDDNTEIIQKKLNEELDRRFSTENPHFNLALVEEQVIELKKENQMLREQNVNLTSEIL